MWKKYTFKDNCKIAYWFYKGSKIGSSVFTITSKNIQLAQKMLDVRLLINKWWDSKREIGPSLKCIWYKVIMWSTPLPRTWTNLTLARGAFVGLTNLTLKKKEKSKKKDIQKRTVTKIQKIDINHKISVKRYVWCQSIFIYFTCYGTSDLNKTVQIYCISFIVFYKVWKRFNIEQKGYRTAQKNNQMFLVFQQYFSKPFLKKQTWLRKIITYKVHNKWKKGL